VVRIEGETIGKTRDEIFRELRTAGIGVNVHYIPVHLHPFYRKRFGTSPGLCLVAEKTKEAILSIPIYPTMSQNDIGFVIDTIMRIVIGSSKAE